MTKKLYVGNLSFQTTNQDLQELFAQAGTVESAQIIEDRDTGQSRGFGIRRNVFRSGRLHPQLPVQRQGSRRSDVESK